MQIPSNSLNPPHIVNENQDSTDKENLKKDHSSAQATNHLGSKILNNTNQSPSHSVISASNKMTDKVNEIKTIKIFQILKDIFEEEEYLINEMIKPLFNKETTDNEKQEMFEFVRTIPVEERNLLIPRILPLCKGKKTSEQIQILKKINDFPLNERSSVIEDIKILDASKYETSAIITIFDLLRKIPSDKRSDLISSIISSFEDRYFQILMLEIISELSVNEAEFIILSIPHLLKDLTQSHQETFLDWINNIPPAEKKSTIEFTQQLFQNLDEISKTSIYSRLVSLPFDISITKNEILFFKDLDFDEKMQMLHLFKTSFPIDRKILTEMAQPLWLLNKKEIANILFTFTFFPHSHLKEIHEFLQQHPTTINSSFQHISNFLQEKPDLKEIMYTHLIQRLQSTNKEDVREIAFFIVNHSYTLLIDDENHFLIQEAINKIILLDSISESKNPYQIYERLKEETLQPTPSFNISFDLVENKKMSWNLEGLQKFAQQKVVITYGQLPQEVKSNSLIQAFENLDKRIQNASDPFEIEALIQTMSSIDFQALQSNFTKDSYLNYLLQAQGDSSEAAPIDVVRFRAIVKYILDQSNECKKGQILSDQEEALIKYSASIQECSTGKSEGIAIAYQYLPLSYKFHKEEALFSSQEKGMDYLNSLLQTTLNDTFSNKEMLQDIIETDQEIEQLSHQALFLKNRIGMRVGFQHTLKFDPYTFTLYDNLIEKDLAQTLQIFFKHFKPQQLISLLMTNFERDKSSIHQLYGSLTSLFPEKVIINEMWDYDDETDQFQLTEKGALGLWLAAKILKE